MDNRQTILTETVLNNAGLREILHKEIDLIEAVITRMAHNSFLVKGWILSICAFVITIRQSVPLTRLSLLLIVPILSFWWLDSYYLRLERAFRSLYDERLKQRTENNDWSGLYKLNIKQHLIKQQPVRSIMISSSTFPFYFFLIAVFLGLAIHNGGLRDVYLYLTERTNLVFLHH